MGFIVKSELIVLAVVRAVNGKAEECNGNGVKKSFAADDVERKPVMRT